MNARHELLNVSILQIALRGHVVACRQPGAAALMRLLLLNVASIPEYFKVVLLRPATSIDDVRKQLQHHPATRIRGKIVVRWALHFHAACQREGIACDLDQ